MLAASIAVLCLGDTFVFFARTVGNVQYGLSAILRNPWDGFVIGAGLLIVLIGKAMLVWLADLEHEPAVWTWSRWGAIGTVLWGIATVIIELVR